ncbi:Arginase [Staphylococcus aureus]|uniref:hypothetical protein n=1 Tax=Staphylococcus aureus TaxID=1280 RepID=UPI0007695C08|nr:Arginase [Staphylococcus aureus]
MTKTKAIDIIGAPSTFGQRKLGVDFRGSEVRILYGSLLALSILGKCFFLFFEN